MDRRSDKHSPKSDDQMRGEIDSLVKGAPAESRSAESREMESAAEGEFVPDARLAGGAAAPDSLAPDDVEARAELARHLRPSAFPAGRDALVAAAQSESAPDGIVARLEGLPAGTEFANSEQVWEALGGDHEQRR